MFKHTALRMLALTLAAGTAFSPEASAQGATEAKAAAADTKPPVKKTALLKPDRAIKVKFGEPNVWSLDQAHYLLEQRFQKNQTLEATRPGADELNANAVNGTRLSAVRQLLQAGVGFDQNAGLNNQFAEQRMREDLNLRPERRRQVDESLRKQAEIAAKIQAIADDPTSYLTKADGMKDLTPEAKAKTGAYTIQLDTEKRVGETYKAALTDSVPTQLAKPDLQPDKVNLSGATLDIFKDKLAFGDPKLAASNAVDNFVNLQNEMIMKQVTLLRNEAGLNRRIVFAELPQAFDVDGSRWYAKRAENKLVRIEWKLNGFMYVPLAKLQALRSTDEVLLKGFLRRWLVDMCATLACSQSERASRIKALKDIYADDPEAKAALDWLAGNAKYSEIETAGGKAPESVDSKMPAGTLRTIDLVPRQSSLNVNDRHYASSSVNFSGLFRLLSGLGGNVNYQRQKETYEQYLNQEIFATSFGKGASEFGWTFGPNPGTKAVSPGQRTTYAIFSVPANALAVMLTAKACVYDRRDAFKSTDCEEMPAEFPLPIPSEFDSGFWVEEARYVPVVAGSRTTLYLSGRHFSTLTGVTINGIPLRRSIGLAPPYMAQPAPAPVVSEVEGEYEILAPNKIVTSFRMPPSFTGTPVIALITPVKARFINDLPLRLRVGTKAYERMPLAATEVFPMFYPRTEVRAVRRDDSGNLVVEGSGLVNPSVENQHHWASYYWNGHPVDVTSPATVSTLHHQYSDRVVLKASLSNMPQNAELRMELMPEFGVPPFRYLVLSPPPPGVVKASLIKYAAYKKKVPATKDKPEEPAVNGVALLELQGAGFDDKAAAKVTLSHGNAMRPGTTFVNEGRVLVNFSLEEDARDASFALITLSTIKNPASSTYVELPAPDEKKAPTDEISETITKRVPIKKVDPPK